MIIQPIPPNNPTFGIYLKTTPKYYGYVMHGLFKNNYIDIYTVYEDNLLKHKLYYVKNNAGNWIKSKLKSYHKGKLVGQSRSEYVRKDFNIHS